MIGYLDLPSGISGDMFLGCLVDVGWPVEQLHATLGAMRLPEGSWSIAARPVMKGALRATLVDVRVAEGEHSHAQTQPQRGHDHGHADHHHGAAHHHGTPHHHGHGKDQHSHGEHTHPPKPAAHGHRNLVDVRRIIESSTLSAGVKDRAVAVFHRLAAAEAKVHGCGIDEIHFHEVGALDAIVDIVGVVAGVAALGIDRLFCSPLPIGGGWIKSAHGQLPLPAPATLELLSAAGAPIVPARGPGELVTPTGAALVAELASFGQPAMTLRRTGLGAGQKDFDWPNIARLWLGEAIDAARPASAGAFVQIETNIDDMNPQLYPAVTEELFAAGARDVWLTPIQMKKNRPGVVISVLASADLERAMADIILRQTTSLGVRVSPVTRHEAQRRMQTVATAYGPVAVKLKLWGDSVIGATPEFDDCRRIAAAGNIPVRHVLEAAQAAAHGLVDAGTRRPTAVAAPGPQA